MCHWQVASGLSWRRASRAASAVAPTCKLTIRTGTSRCQPRMRPSGRSSRNGRGSARRQIVNVERIPGAPVTLELRDVREEQALDVLLRSVSGYLAAPRATTIANASAFDRILVMPTSVGAGSAAPPAAAQQPPFNPTAAARTTTTTTGRNAGRPG